MDEIGKIKHIRRYPVKSMCGEDLDEVFVTESGIQGDRVYAFVVNNAPNKRFPWMTARQAHEMLLFKPRFVSDPTDVEVESRDGKIYSIHDEEFVRLLEEKSGYDVSLTFRSNGCFDSNPISLFGLDTVRELERETSISLDHRRFRANFYVKWQCGKPFYEDELVGNKLGIGPKAVVEIVKKDSRCILPTLDPFTIDESPGLLDTIKKNHRGCVGVYATVSQEGNVRLDDQIHLLQD
jgi:uncharacterized protein YcbX